jgi:type 1 glutamine amidotransferase
MPTSPHVTIVSGHNRYADSWHDLPATSHLIALALADDGLDVTVVGSWPRELADLAGTDLLVVNAGVGLPHGSIDGQSSDDAWQRGWAGLSTYLESGRPLLAVHQAANTLHEVPEYLDRLGGRWVAGTSMHPPIGTATVSFGAIPHPINPAPGTSFELWDERYSYLDVTGAVTVLATHVHDDTEHPLVWTHDHAGGRAVYDALGHGRMSFDSGERRDLLRREARWLLSG